MNNQISSEGLSGSQEFARGWLVLFACFIGIAGGIASTNYTSGIFIVSIEEEFGWSRAAISAQIVLSVIVLAIASPFVGMLIDRIGIKTVAATSLAGYALGLYGASYWVSSLWSFYAIWIATAVIAAGSSPVTFTRAITGWFNKKRGLALGIALMGTGLVGFVAPLLLTDFVAEHGWRSGYRALGAVIFLSAIIVLFFMKDDPEQSVSNDGEVPSSTGVKPGLSYKEALTKREFYIMGVMFFFVSLAVSGPIIHFIPMLLDLGLEPAKAGSLTALIGISVMAGRLIAGLLIDHFFAPRIAAILFAIAAIGYLSFLLGGVAFAAFAAIALGASIGAEVDLIGYLVSRYFGLNAYGAIYGMLYAVFLIGAGLSPVVTGFIYDVSGSYNTVFVAATVALSAASILAMTLRAFPNFDPVKQVDQAQ